MAPVTRRLAAISVLLATGAMLAGCGKSGVVTVTSATTITTAKPQHAPAPAPREPPSSGAARAKAQAFARAVNLRAADVPGFVTSHEGEHHESQAQRHVTQELHECAGRQALAQGVFEAGSGEFARKASIARQGVSSQVAVAGSASAATEALASLRSPRVRTCLSRYFSKLLTHIGSQGANVGAVTTKYGTPPAPGTGGSFGLRVTAIIGFRGIHLPFYIDYLSFVDGAGEISLLSLGTPVPFPANIEERLFSLLVARAKAHSA
jgi:hypothetical protein